MLWNKYQSLGNDFLIASLAEYEKYVGKSHGSESSDWIRPIVLLCDRKRGFGADGVMLHSEPRNGNVQCLLINSNGSFANFSGNGFACLASHFVAERQLCINDTFHTLRSDNRVEISVQKFSSMKDRYFFEHSLSGYDYSLWDVGNEHAVFLKFVEDPSDLLFTDPFNSFDKLEEGKLESHFRCSQLYPDGINVGLALVGENWIQLKVWERGCGWTEACSSGAIAAFLAANTPDKMVGEVKIMQSGGESLIDWLEPDRTVIRLKLNPSFVGRVEYEIKR